MFDNKKMCQIKTSFFKQRKKLFLTIFVSKIRMKFRTRLTKICEFL